MESELKDLNSQSSRQALPESMDEGSAKDDSNPTSQSVSTEHLEELEKKFAAFVRKDVYGTMGRGELPWAEKVLLAVAFVTLVPIRVAVAVTLSVLYYLICRVCTLFSAPNREDEQEDYAHLGGWRRTVIVQCGRFLSRVMLFVLGFYWIEETYRDPDLDEKLKTETECKDQSEEPERPGAIISNHISYLDILYHMSSTFRSFVAKRSVAKLPLVGLISKCLGCVFVQRESKSSDFKGISGVVGERVREAHENKFAPMMMVFPGDHFVPVNTH
ncbi:hypothetical protein F0562_019664 [Nyssa sinensis]|uniref:Phospholipid/glycerol acyltransferase domain-containing protein n=1 Tax=Nyssa sinensis TaxID=561372 RepID=A0A5J5BUI6_9ASTE|nr:hypothetical protein F0562_019664 [Nyssa sinensis]